jgi:DNA repair protein RecO (recombination protein O)
MSSPRRRLVDPNCFLLHSYPWRETSLIVEIFSREHGRVPMAAKGARRPASALRGVLMAFQPLEVAWTGQGEVKTLTGASWQGGHALLGGVGLLCGYYLNELLLRLLPREDAHPALFDAYAQTLSHLAAGQPNAPLLRVFELTLLREAGYAPTLDHDVETGEVVQQAGRYLFLNERGPVAAADRYGDLPTVPGRVLLAMAAGDFSASETLSYGKNLMRQLLQYHLGGQPLESRRILMELQEL